MLPSDFLNLTLAGLIAWLLTYGIAAGVGYAVSWLGLTGVWRTVVNAVLVAGLTAMLVAAAALIPQTFMDSRLIDLFVALVTLLLSHAGFVAGQVRAVNQRLALRASMKSTDFELMLGSRFVRW